MQPITREDWIRLNDKVDGLYSEIRGLVAMLQERSRTQAEDKNREEQERLVEHLSTLSTEEQIVYLANRYKASNRRNQ